MSPGVCGVVERRMLVNYRVDLGRLDAALPGPFRGREVGETGKGIGTVCLTRVENARPKLAPERAGMSVRSVTHRVPAEIQGEGRFCAYVPLRGVSSRLCATLGSHALPAEIGCAEFRTEQKTGVRLTTVNCGGEYVGVEETMDWVEKDRGIEPEGGSEGTDEGKKVATAGRKEERRTEELSRVNPRTREAATKGSGEAETSAGIEDGSVFYSPESASVFLCDGGVEYMPAGHRDGRYKRVEPSAE
jgi:hypothetical protein